MMSPAAATVQRRDGANAWAAAGRRAVSGQVATDATRSTPNSALPLQESARTAGPTASARRNPRRPRFAARAVARAPASATSVRLVRGAWASPSAARIAGASARTSRRPLNRLEVPARAVAASAGSTFSSADRNWTTGTIGTSARPAAGDGVAETVGAVSYTHLRAHE